MRISRCARLGLRIAMSLAQRREQPLAVLREIAADHKISRKYVHRLLATLKAAGYVESVRGSSGGFKLSCPPEQIRLGDLVASLEGGLHLTKCVSYPKTCPRSHRCAARDFWSRASADLLQALNKTTLAELAAGQQYKEAGATDFEI